MSSDCIVKISNGDSETRIVNLYAEQKGYLARTGAIVAIAARNALETGNLDVMSETLYVTNLDFGPVNLDGVNTDDIPYQYHIMYYPDINHVEIDYRKDGDSWEGYTLADFIRKVNKARKSANYPYKMLRQARPLWRSTLYTTVRPNSPPQQTI